MSPGLISRCKSRLKSDDWEQFEAATDTSSAVRILSHALRIDLDANPVLEHFMAQTPDLSSDDIVSKVMALRDTTPTVKLMSVSSELTRLISQACEPAGNTNRSLPLLYRLRALVHIMRHEKVEKRDQKHERTAYTSALVDLESANFCEAHSQPEELPDELRNLETRLADARKRCDASASGHTLPVQLIREADSPAPDTPDSDGGADASSSPETDEGYRSRSQSPAAASAFTVCHSPSKGRFLRAACSLAPGDEVLSESAFIFALSSELHQSRCSNCLNRINNLVAKCPNNCPVVYCSALCRDQGKRIHCMECPLIGIILSENTHFQLTIRFFLMSLRSSNAQSRQAADLSHHFGHYPASYRFVVAVRAVFTAVVLSEMGVLSLGDDMQNGCPLMSRILTQLCQIETNSVSMVDRIGSAIFTQFSLTCHSCSPNLDYRYHKKGSVPTSHRTAAPPRLWLTANQMIAKGTELTISYTSGKSVHERRQRLHHSYLFHCFCDLCLRELRGHMDLQICQPVTKCIACPNDLASAETPLLSDEQDPSAHPKYLFACQNAACSEYGNNIDFERKLTFFSDFLLCQTTATRCKVSDAKAMQSILSSCLKRYDIFSTYFQTPNLLQLDFEVFLCKLLHTFNNHPESLMWAAKAFSTSHKLLGCHTETAINFQRLILSLHAQPSIQSLSHDDRDRQMKDTFHSMGISDSDVLFYNEEVSAGSSGLNNFMKL